MYIIYNIVLLILLVILFPVWIIILASAKKYRAGITQKLGFLPDNLKKTLKGFNIRPVWFHAVSVGECLAIVDLVKAFHSKHPDLPVVLTTVTFTGQEIAKKRLGTIATIFYFPFDLGIIVSKVMNIVNPQLVVIVETEIWPNFSHNVHARNIPLVLINGRLSPKSYGNYSKVKFFTKIILGNFTRFLMQTAIDEQRIINIGANKEKVQVAGNLKYDIDAKYTREDIDKLRMELNLTDRDSVIIAGSTHSTEETTIIEAYEKLKEDLPELKLIIVPRHPERYEEVIGLLDVKKLAFGKRSEKSTFKEASILLLDTMGELSFFYSIAAVAFIGGSLVQKGGHNPLEPAIYDVPVVMGPYTFNFLEISEYMERAGALIKVNDNKELYSELFRLLTDEEYYQKASKACKQVFNANKGATNSTIQILEEYLNG